MLEIKPFPPILTEKCLKINLFKKQLLEVFYVKNPFAFDYFKYHITYHNYKE